MNSRYPLLPFRIHDQPLLCDIMREWPLATLMSGNAGNTNISLIPLVVKEESVDGLRLLGHLDANNDHAKSIVEGAPISFVFNGPDSYASPDLYPGPQLPGWLYISVQGQGKIDNILSTEELRALLCESTDQFGDDQQKFRLNASDARIDQFIGGIRGFSISVLSLSGIAKLAQDKGADDAHRATEFLAKTTTDSARSMLRRILTETMSGN